MVPSRAAASSLAATLKDTVAMPCPDAGDNAKIQPTFVDASQVHSGCVVTASEPVPPAASIIGTGARVIEHLTGFGPVESVDDPVSQAEINAAATLNRIAADEARRARAIPAARGCGSLSRMTGHTAEQDAFLHQAHP